MWIVDKQRAITYQLYFMSESIGLTSDRYSGISSYFVDYNVCLELRCWRYESANDAQWRTHIVSSPSHTIKPLLIQEDHSTETIVLIRLVLNYGGKFVYEVGSKLFTTLYRLQESISVLCWITYPSRECVKLV